MITIVTAWYMVKNKFNINIYNTWIDNFLSNANCNIVIFTNKDSKYIIEHYLTIKTNIKVIVKELDEFYTFKYKDEWISNQNRNDNPLKNQVSWELNMIWNEKINFVKEASILNIFNTDYFAWCDIGYFRCRPNIDISIDLIKKWPNYKKISSLDNTKIYYNMIRNPKQRMRTNILRKNSKGLPMKPIPHNQISFGGGFFLLHKNLINSWYDLFYSKLQLYFDNNYLVKDDQIILVDCIISNYDKFCIVQQKQNNIDKWFSFQTFLL